MTVKYYQHIKYRNVVFKTVDDAPYYYSGKWRRTVVPLNFFKNSPKYVEIAKEEAFLEIL